MGSRARTVVAAAVVVLLVGAASAWFRFLNRAPVPGASAMPGSPTRASVSPPSELPTGTHASGPTSPATPQEAPSATGSGCIVYYFHRTLRCETCLQFEEWGKQVVDKVFTADQAAGKVTWRAINLDTPANHHFEKEFDLAVQSLVLVRQADGRVLEWKKLKAIWDWAGDRDGFTRYVREELSSFIAQPSGNSG